MTMLLSSAATASAANTAADVDRPTETLTGMATQIHALVHATYVWISHNALRVAIAAAIGTLLVLGMLAIKTVAIRLCREVRGQPPSMRTLIGRMASKTSFWFMVVLVVELLIRYTGAPRLLDSTVHVLWVALLVGQSALWLRELIIGLIERRAGVGDQDNTSSLGSAMGIIRLLVTATLIALATILILDNLGVNVTGLVAGLGIGGIAIGMAAKGIFDDLFAALAILFDKPFRRGDSVQAGAVAGTVESIGLKTTRIRAGTGEEVIVSNAGLLSKELRNMTLLNYRQAALTFALVYALPPEKQRAVGDMVGAIVGATAKCVFVRCAVTGFGDFGVTYELLFNVMSPDYADFAKARTEICLKIIEKFAAEDIRFAYPSQIGYTAAPDGRLIMPWPEGGDDKVATQD